MTEEIKTLYEQAPRFDEGDLYQSAEYTDAARERIDLETLTRRLFGNHAATILEEYTEVMDRITELECQHYFEQGYQAGKQLSRIK